MVVLSWQNDPLLLDPEPAAINEWLTANKILESNTNKTDSFIDLETLTLNLYSILVRKNDFVREKESELIYQIIMVLVNEKMERGYTKKYSLAELQEKLPWKKSRLIEKLQRVAEEGVLIHEKRKYKLNKENELVKRIWNYYNETSQKEKGKMAEIWKLIQRRNELEKKLAEKTKKEKGKYKEMTRKEDEKFQENFEEELMDTPDPLEEAIIFLRKNKEKVMGYVKQKEENGGRSRI